MQYNVIKYAVVLLNYIKKLNINKLQTKNYQRK